MPQRTSMLQYKTPRIPDIEYTLWSWNGLPGQ